jgi:hypothetical protein
LCCVVQASTEDSLVVEEETAHGVCQRRPEIR